jgi:phenylacetate-coenzyme A ligase PaaK-like adenylate-forming protein
MNPEREQKLILPKLQEQLNDSFQGSLLNRKKLDSAGVKPKPIRFLADFVRVPRLNERTARSEKNLNVYDQLASAEQLKKLKGTRFRLIECWYDR